MLTKSFLVEIDGLLYIVLLLFHFHRQLKRHCKFHVCNGLRCMRLLHFLSQIVEVQLKHLATNPTNKVKKGNEPNILK